MIILYLLVYLVVYICIDVASIDSSVFPILLLIMTNSYNAKNQIS